MAKSEKCEVCKEMINRPIPRVDNRIVCDDCWYQKKISGPRETGEKADRQYHGGQWNQGEW